MASLFLRSTARNTILRRCPSTSTSSRRTFQQCMSATLINTRAFSEAAQTIPGVGKGKTSTGLVGLAVDHDAIPKIITKYTALLHKAQQMPPTAQYRINIEKICNFRISAAQAHPDDPEKVEELCQCGQVEELVQQADDEMMVMEMYLKERWWEQVQEVDIETDPSTNKDGGHGDVEWDEDDTKKE